MNQKAVLGITVLFLLAVAPLVIGLKQASAQVATQVPSLSHQMIFYYTDGTTYTVSDQASGVPQYTYSLTQGSKTVDHVENKMILSIPQPGATLNYSAASETMQVIGRDGMYHYVPLTVIVDDYHVQALGGGTYLIHDSTVSAATIESTIGIGSTPFNAVIRVQTAPAGAAAGILYQGTKTVYSIQQTHPNYSITACTSTTLCGGTGGGGGGGGGGTGNPTGQIYQVANIYYTDGSSQSVVLTPSQTIASVTFSGGNAPSYKNITHIDWNLDMVVDNDVFSLPSLYNNFASSTATNNFGVLVNNQGVANNANNHITKISQSPAQYHLLDIDVQMSNVQPLLTPAGTGTGGVSLSTGTITYSVAPATLVFTGSTAIPISVQAFSTSYSLVGATVTGGGGGGSCEINPTSCGGGLPFPTDPTTLAELGVVVAGGGGAAAYAIKRKK